MKKLTKIILIVSGTVPCIGSISRRFYVLEDGANLSMNLELLAQK